MNIEVGEYVRTKKGDIRKVTDILIKHIAGIGKPYSVYYLDDKRIGYVRSKYIVKHSVNVIDLIEVGDYVNGIKVDGLGDGTYIIHYDGDGDLVVFSEDFETIVTKEQFKEMEYKINE